MLRKILIVTLIGFSALSLAQAADLTIDKPDVKVGDIWKYRILDGFTNEPKFEINFRTVSISDSEITVRMTWKGNQNSRLAIFDRQWNMLDDGTAKWDPSRSEFKFPMRVGESWARRYQVTNIKTGATSACISDAKVAANEKVTVPAGTFDTFRLETEIECRSTGNDASLMKYAMKNWYSPEANRSVRQESQTFADGRVRDKSVVELIEYTPAKLGN